jgi:hypothetical protein
MGLCVLAVLATRAVGLAGEAPPAATQAMPTGTTRGAVVGLKISGHTKAGQFEIVMNGAQNYFCKEWAGQPEHADGFCNVTLIVGRFHGVSNDSWTEMGPEKVGGTYGNDGTIAVAPGRRLWEGDKLIGADPQHLIAQLQKNRYTEEFRDLRDSGGIAIPGVIIWTDNVGNSAIAYTIEKIEPLDKTDEAVFKQAKTQYFPDADKTAATKPAK